MTQNSKEALINFLVPASFLAMLVFGLFGMSYWNGMRAERFAMECVQHNIDDRTCEWLWHKVR